MTIAEFLDARLRETEYAALGDISQPTPPYYTVADIAAKRRIVARYDEVRRSSMGSDAFANGISMARMDELETVVKILASVYSDHDDFHVEWTT